MAGRLPSSYLRTRCRVPWTASCLTETSRMKPSSRSTSQMRCLILLVGRSSSSSPARCALRIRVNRSATGSVMLICHYLRRPYPWARRRRYQELDYQDDLITPVISPFRARLRKQMRHIWNLLRNARLRPHSSQREYARTLNFGFFCRRLACAILESLAILMTPLRRSRGSREVGGSSGERAPPLWRRRKAPDRRAFRRGTRFRAASSCRPEGHAHVAEQSATLFVAPRRGHDGDVHALD